MEYIRSKENQARWNKAHNYIIIVKFIGYFFLVLGLVAFIYYMSQISELKSSIDKINSLLKSFEVNINPSELKTKYIISAIVYLVEGVSLCVICNIVSRLVEHKYNMETLVKKQEVAIKTLNDKVDKIERGNALKRPDAYDDFERMK